MREQARAQLHARVVAFCRSQQQRRSAWRWPDRQLIRGRAPLLQQFPLEQPQSTMQQQQQVQPKKDEE